MAATDNKLTICSVGDLMICDSPLYASVGVGSRYSAIREELLRSLCTDFAGADLVIGNFETVVHDPRDRSLKETQMCCPESVVQDLRDAGFSVLNLANNHCMQHGTDGFRNTRAACEKYGIKPIGVRDEEPCILELNGVRLALLSLCIHLEWYEPDHILYEDRIDRILGEVKELRSRDADLVIVVSVHWGDEFAAHPSNAQIALAHRLVDDGADVILGHHSHVCQGTEAYKGAVIAYSQGNFISDMVPKMCRQTEILRLTVTQDSKQKQIRYEVLPCLAGADDIPRRAEGEWVNARRAELEDALAGRFSDDDYWTMIRRNHATAHNSFKSFFKKNVGSYQLRVSSRMLIEFAGRKLKRLRGTSTDGRVSSMDPVIIKILREEE